MGKGRRERCTRLNKTIPETDFSHSKIPVESTKGIYLMQALFSNYSKSFNFYRLLGSASRFYC